MTDTKTLHRIEIRAIADKYLISEREPDLRTAQPLPADYKAFKEEYSGDADTKAIEQFEEAWADLYDSQNA